MFLCLNCLENKDTSLAVNAEYRWPISHGICEGCEQDGLCYDVPSMQLPVPDPPKQDRIELLLYYDGGGWVYTGKEPIEVIDVAVVNAGICPWCGNDLPSAGGNFCGECGVDWFEDDAETIRRQLYD